LIQELEDHEKKFKSKYKASVDFDYYNSLLESSKIQLAEYEKYLNLFSISNEERDKKGSQCDKLVSQLKSTIIKELKSKLLSNLTIRFNPIDKIDLFGKLEINVCKKIDFNFGLNILNLFFIFNLRLIQTEGRF
jgi:hypothetical protein